MDTNDQRARRDLDDHDPTLFLHSPIHQRSLPSPAVTRSDPALSGYTLMVAGSRTGKTSFLRLLLDTCDIAPSATKDQLHSVAKFVQGCAGHTAHLRTVSIDVDLDPNENGQKQPVNLTLVDTPSLSVHDPDSSERIVADMLRHVESKFRDSVDDDYKAQTGDHHVHLCVYFLDPDDIVPPHVPTPPAPLLSRTRTNSVSLPESPPVILEPPVTTNPALCRPGLPASEVTVIRRLSIRVNVLPVIARADTLTNDRLTAIKMAVRRDLAEAGIGFGIFDLETHPQYQYDILTPTLNGDSKPYPGLANGSSSSSSASSPTTPVTPFPRIPYALIAPDMYSHSDGVNRVAPSRQELVHQYTPSPNNYHISSHKIIRGKFVRSYRWGSLDVLDHNHCDFMPLRQAIFHHMQALQKYTRDYLLNRFRAETTLTRSPPEAPVLAAPPAVAQLPALSSASRPILTIDAAPNHTLLPGHASLPSSRQASGSTVRPPPTTSGLSDSGPESKSSSHPKSQRLRTKKITVACNFCRSRKLKCDGGRPACHQCVKRSNACDYMAPQKRRGGVRQRRGAFGIGSDSDGGSGDEPLETEPSQSPEVRARPIGGDALPPLAHEPFAQPEPLHALPSLAASFPPPALGASAPPLLPPIRAAEEEAAAPASAPLPRKRSATVGAKGNRTASNYGPKVVACNFCRARKTKCDGAHPTCSSCARRSLDCSYVNDPAPTRRKSAAPAPTAAKAPPSGLSSVLLNGPPEGYGGAYSEGSSPNELKRERGEEGAGAVGATKRVRVDGPHSGSASVAVSSGLV